MVKVTSDRVAEIADMKSRMKSGQNISASELKSYSAEDMMKGRFDRSQELVNRIPMMEREVARLKGAGANEEAFRLQLKLNELAKSNPKLSPNNNPFYDLKGNPNPENQAVARSMEISGSSKPQLSNARRVWNLGEYNNTIKGQGGNAMIPAIAGAGATMLLGELVSRTPDLQLTVHDAGSGSDTLPTDEQYKKDIYNEFRKSKALKNLK